MDLVKLTGRSLRCALSSLSGWTNHRGQDDGDCYSCQKGRSWLGLAESKLCSYHIPSAQNRTNDRHQEALKADGPVLLPPTDPRCQRISRIMTRLITALEEQDHTVVSGASWPPRGTGDLARVISEREASEGRDLEARYQPSGVAQSTFMPFRPVSSNPLKKLESADWNLYVVDLVSRLFVVNVMGNLLMGQPQMNAFALPSKDIFVYTGLLDVLPDDNAMLAAVLAHEVAHVVERHSVENLGVSPTSSVS